MDSVDNNEPPAPYSFVMARGLDQIHNGYDDPIGQDPALILRNDDRECPHAKGGCLVIDAEKRTVRCRRCGAFVNAFDALLAISRAERRWAKEVERYQSVRRDLSDIGRIDREHGEVREAKWRKRCKHTYAQPTESGVRYCPTCRQFLDSEVPPLTIAATAASEPSA